MGNFTSCCYKDNLNVKGDIPYTDIKKNIDLKKEIKYKTVPGPPIINNNNNNHSIPKAIAENTDPDHLPGMV